MASHQISIKQEVYIRLKNSKFEDESFSDIIDRLLDKDSNVSKVLSMYGKAVSDDPEVEKIILDTYKEALAESRKLSLIK